MLHKDFKEFLQLLNAEKVEYLLVGGYAVTFYGYPRFTGDLDIWINSNEENTLKVMNVVNTFGFSSLGIKKEDLLNKGIVVQLGYSPVRIDIITDLDGLDFAESYNNKKTSFIDGINIDIISLDDLIHNKKATGRYKDLDDVEHLEK